MGDWRQERVREEAIAEFGSSVWVILRKLVPDKDMVKVLELAQEEIVGLALELADREKV